MKFQFSAGLAHCRHLKTVRTHLSGLVNQSIIAVDNPCDASMGLTPELWKEMSASGVVSQSSDRNNFKVILKFPQYLFAKVHILTDAHF